MYNLAKLEQTITKLSLDEQKSLNENYNKIIEKYNLNSCDQYGDDYWIKIAMEHLKVSNPSKSLNELIEYLIKNEYINPELKSDYKSYCDFIHSSQNAFGLTQCINIDDNNYKYMSGAINDFNFIIYSIIEQLNKKINLIFISYENKVKSNLNDIINFKD